MCEHVDIFRLEGKKIYTRYRILSFHSESETDWMFEVVKTGYRQDGYDWEPIENAKPKMLTFSKKRKTGEKDIYEELANGQMVKRKAAIFEQLSPPSFYWKLRDKAIDEGKWKLPGDDAPSLDDKDLFS